jgi:hypothetical protein
MPKQLTARRPCDTREERQVRKLTHRVHATGDWIVHAKIVARRWDGLRTRQIAEELGDGAPSPAGRQRVWTRQAGDAARCWPQAAADPARAQQHPRPDEVTASGQADVRVDRRGGRARSEGRTRVDARHADRRCAPAGIQVARSQVRRIFRREGLRWRRTRRWATSKETSAASTGSGSTAR